MWIEANQYEGIQAEKSYEEICQIHYKKFILSIVNQGNHKEIKKKSKNQKHNKKIKDILFDFKWKPSIQLSLSSSYYNLDLISNFFQKKFTQTAKSHINNDVMDKQAKSWSSYN